MNLATSDSLLSYSRLSSQKCDSHHTSVCAEPGQEGARAQGGEEEGGQAPDPDAAAHGRHVPSAEEEGQC